MIYSTKILSIHVGRKINGSLDTWRLNGVTGTREGVVEGAERVNRKSNTPLGSQQPWTIPSSFSSKQWDLCLQPPISSGRLALATARVGTVEVELVWCCCCVSPGLTVLERRNSREGGQCEASFERMLMRMRGVWVWAQVRRSSGLAEVTNG